MCSRTKSVTSRCGTGPHRPVRPRRIRLGRFSDKLRAPSSAASPARPFHSGARLSPERFSQVGREYERQADLLGVQIMARAGYDPRDMANMFQTLQAKGGSSGPEWMSSHPNPGNRYDAITKEAAQLQVSNSVRNTQEFTQLRSRLQRMAPAPTTEQAMRNGGNRRTSRDTGYPSGKAVVEPPSGQDETFDGGNLFRIAVPSNWRELQGTTR